MIRASTTIPLAVAALCLSAVAAAAALPPYWQSAREISSIVSDPRVHEALAYEEPILSITTAGDDVYELKTERCTLTVTIIDKPMAEPLIGARQFELDIGDAQCE